MAVTDKYQEGEEFGFNAYLDEPGPIQIEQFTFPRSEALYRLDPIAYASTLTEWLENDLKEKAENIIREFPSIIARQYHRQLKGTASSNPVEKWQAMKDTFEGVTYLIYAIVWGEIRARNVQFSRFVVDMTNPGGVQADKSLNVRLVFSNNLKEKIKVLRSILSSPTHSHALILSSQIPLQIFSDLAELQDLRNSFSHSVSPTIQQAEHLISQAEPAFSRMTRSIQFLNQVRICRFTRMDSHLHFEWHKGHSLTPDSDKLPISASLSLLFSRITINELYCDWQNFQFSLAPFLHWGVELHGHFTPLYFFKERDGSGPTYYFESVLGGGGNVDFPHHNAIFDSHHQEIANLIT